MLFLVLALSFFIGSIPFGVIVGGLYGVNIKKVGSGNIGATNVFRTLGPFAGILVLLADAAKGYFSVQLAYLLLSASAQNQILPVAAAIFAVLGHSFSPFMGMSGGKGVSAAAGALIALMPTIALILFIIWLTIIGLTGYVSVASMSISMLMPFLAIITKQNTPNIVLSLIICAIIFYTHRSNISRLRKGEELKFKWGKK